MMASICMCVTCLKIRLISQQVYVYILSPGKVLRHTIYERLSIRLNVESSIELDEMNRI